MIENKGSRSKHIENKIYITGGIVAFAVIMGFIDKAVFIVALALLISAYVYFNKQRNSRSKMKSFAWACAVFPVWVVINYCTYHAGFFLVEQIEPLFF